MIDIYWWSKRKVENSEFDNFGDVLVPYILDRTTTEKYKWVEPNTNKKYNFFRKEHYFIIGSILRKATEHTVVWGAGIIFSDEVVKRARFLAVRGPLTRRRLLELGHQVPEKYGDPAVLVSLFNNEKNRNRKTYTLGIIPHFMDFEEASEFYKGNCAINVINLLTNNPQEIIDQILECEYILSSSLHGIIVSHALNIPVLWLKISNKLFGDDVKFYDYYESVGIQIPKKFSLKKNNTREEAIIIFKDNSKYALPKKENFDKLINDLVETFPFKKSHLFKEAIKTYFKQNA